MENVEAVETLSEEVVSDYEKERGKPIPSFNHGVLQMKLGSMIARFKQFTIGSEITLDLSPKATPDILIFNKRKANWQHDEKRVAEMPLTVIEILSGTQGMGDFEEKLARYFEAGVKSVWLVQPFIETIAIFFTQSKTKGIFNGRNFR